MVIRKDVFVDYRNHAFLIYKDHNKYYYFERTFKFANGIHAFDTIKEAINFYKERQVEFGAEKVTISDIKVREYQNSTFGSSFHSFIEKAKENPIYLELD